VVILAGNLGVQVDTGNNSPGAVLQRLEAGQWTDCEIDGKPVCWPVQLESLQPGQYRLAEKPGQAALD
jgi:hypothetical protein